MIFNQYVSACGPACLGSEEALTCLSKHVYSGGIDAFHSKYSLMYERLSHARDVGRETGAPITVHDDDLPPYSPAAAGGPSAQPVTLQPPDASAAATESEAPQTMPREPPPGYDEAQASAVEQQFDERERQDAERAQ